MALACLICILLFSISLSHVFAICYYPDGSTSPQDTPCYDDSNHATCCGQGYACLSNNICMATGDEIQKVGASLYVRGSCTDQSWRSSSCPSFCVNPDYDLLAGGMGIAKCDGTSEDIYYCIDSNMENVDCDNKVKVITFQGSPTTVTVIGSKQPIQSTSPTSSTFMKTSASISAQTSTSTQASTSTSTTFGTTNSAVPSSEHQSSRSSTTAIAVGSSMGSLAIIVICLVVVYLCRKRRSRSRSAPAPVNPDVNQQQELGLNRSGYQDFDTHKSYQYPTQEMVGSMPNYTADVHEAPPNVIRYELPHDN